MFFLFLLESITFLVVTSIVIIIVCSLLLLLSSYLLPRILLFIKESNAEEHLRNLYHLNRNSKRSALSIASG